MAIVNNGRDALDFLHRSGRHAHWPEGVPQLILTDLNMPQMDGLELLKTIKEDDRLAEIPVVVLTTSTAERDREACALLGANDYLVKPHNFEDFVLLIDTLTTRWLQTDSLAM
ncbi:response regulator [Deinococcus malanensis]|uniref:response regulator n=1 Tax=Deinococcus malanensis TaxID=1706855 RepID=UPI00363571AB